MNALLFLLCTKKMVREERLELSRRKTLEPKSSASTNSATLALPCTTLHRSSNSLLVKVFKLKTILKTGVTDGARTHDHRNHNPGLYQLSYNHHIVVSDLMPISYPISN